MKHLQSLEALVHLEDESPDVLFERAGSTGIHIWPLIRVALGLRSANKELGSGSVHGSWTRSETIKQIRGLAVPNPFNSTHVRPNVDLLIIAGGGTARPTAHGRENWLVDDFANSASERAAVIQDRPIPRRPDPAETPAFRGTSTLRDAYLRVLVKSKLNPLPEEAADQIRGVVREILRHYDFDVEDDLSVVLQGAAVQQVRRSPHWRTEFNRILKRTSPKLVVLDNASYMTKLAITRSIREHKIPIAEPQHGWIGPSHAAYNYGKAFFHGALRQYLPDALLTFGEYWSEGIRHPAVAQPIGKPYLERASATAQQFKVPRKQVLITSSIYRTDELIRLALTIRDSLPIEFTVAVRPHPSERPRADVIYSQLIGQDRVNIDTEPDAYASFSRSRAVIGYASTVLFEALAFDIPVFVIDSPLADLYTPTSVFGERILPDGDLSGLIQKIVSYSTGTASTQPKNGLGRIWKTGGIENFAQYVASVQ